MSSRQLNWNGNPLPFEEYDIAQICENGHKITSKRITSPNSAKDFCPTCGSRTITNCPTCEFPIRGSSTRLQLYSYIPPKYCEKCGEPYPWTQKSLAAADELSEMIEELNTEERELLTKSIKSLSKDTPDIPVAVARVKHLISKLGSESYKLTIKVISDLATEVAKNQLDL